MSNLKPLIYAELLSNIRQISVIVALEEPCDPATKVELSADGQQFILHHSGEIFTLTLPGQTSPNSQLQNPVLGSKELSWRLPLAGRPTRTSAENVQSSDGPWSAKSLGEDAEFLCRDCSNVIVKKGSIKIWKDLPSDNWAEMMDFWHCHKPDVPDANGSSGHEGHVDTEKSMANRGYGANTKFAPTPGVGFVDLTTFLLADANCINIETEVSPDETTNHQTVACKTCHHYIGYTDHQAAGSRLYKWRLRSTQMSLLQSRSTLPLLSTSPSTSTIIGAQLGAIMQSQCLSRIVLSPTQWTRTSQVSNWPESPSPLKTGYSRATPTSSSLLTSATTTSDESSSESPATQGWRPSPGSPCFPFLSLWILTPSLRYSSNSAQLKSETGSAKHLRTLSTGPNSGIPAMKVFWKPVTVETAGLLVESTGVEEVLLPTGAICEIEACLRSSSSSLPPSARKFQDWDVGLLERYEE